MLEMMSAVVELALTPRGEEAGVHLVFLSSRLISRSVRDLRVCSVGLEKSRARSFRITEQRLGCHRAVLSSGQCSQTSAGVWHRAWPRQRSEEAAFGVLF